MTSANAAIVTSKREPFQICFPEAFRTIVPNLKLAYTALFDDAATQIRWFCVIQFPSLVKLSAMQRIRSGAGNHLAAQRSLLLTSPSLPSLSSPW
jgi:hypothetical protein